MQRRRTQQLAILTRNILKLRYIKDDAEKYGSRQPFCNSERCKLELLEENPQIQLMFSDVVLPGGMNGVELWREAERRHGNLKVLFTSGYMADALPQYDLLNDGVMELLPKPYRKPELARRIAAFLEPD